MDIFFKIAGLAMITVILTLFLGKCSKDTAVLLSMAACCIAGAAAFHYIEPVFSFLSRLEDLGNLQDGLLQTLLKVVGITLVSEFAGTMCADSGNGSLAKMLHFLGSGAILYLSLPAFTALFDLIGNIVGEL